MTAQNKLLSTPPMRSSNHCVASEPTFALRGCVATSLAEELRRVSSEPEGDAAELFRRMCFNALISNIDDHPRNHALVANDKDWTLSPAYDLTPAIPVSVEHRDLAMECGDAGRFANADNMLTQSGWFLLAHEQARAIIDAMETQVRDSWYATAREAGVSSTDCDRIAGAFAYAGFRHELVAAGRRE